MQEGGAGTNLSGGQRQRVALARALLADPPVLVLHDPTTSVDPVTESVIADGLARLRADRIAVLVTASPILLNAADRVVVLRRGRVIAEGTHTPTWPPPTPATGRWFRVDPTSRVDPSGRTDPADVAARRTPDRHRLRDLGDPAGRSALARPACRWGLPDVPRDSDTFGLKPSLSLGTIAATGKAVISGLAQWVAAANRRAAGSIVRFVATPRGAVPPRPAPRRSERVAPRRCLPPNAGRPRTRAGTSPTPRDARARRSAPPWPARSARPGTTPRSPSA